MPISWQKPTPWLVPSVSTTEMSDSYALEILDDVGANRPLRDSVDTRIISEFINETASHIDNITYPDALPVFTNIAAPVDSDLDGMSDVWETSQGFNIGLNDSTLDSD